MATGPEHYREAERLAVLAHRFTYGDAGDPAAGAALAAEAQVHAILALTAAVALSAPSAAGTGGMPPAIARAWRNVASAGTGGDR